MRELDAILRRSANQNQFIEPFGYWPEGLECNDISVLKLSPSSNNLPHPELLKRHSAPIHIEEDCWIGFGTYIKRGVYIRRGVVIGSNSTITKDVKSYFIMGRH